MAATVSIHRQLLRVSFQKQTRPMSRSDRVPEALRDAWEAKHHLIVSHDGTRIDFHGGSVKYPLNPKHLTKDELTRVTDTFVVSLVHQKVTAINVALCGSLTDESIEVIAKDCPELKELNVSRCENLTDSSMKAIVKGCPELMELNVRGIENLTDSSIKAIGEGCPELKELNVEECSKLTDESIKAIARGCPELKVLDVGHIQNLTNESVKAIAKGCRELKVLNVGHVQNLTDSSIKAIAKDCPELNELNVSNIRNLTDKSITAIAKGCPALEELNVAGCRQISYLSIKAIGKGCPELRELNVAGCRQISDSSIKAIVKGCPELMALNVRGIENLTDSSIKAIGEGCPELKELNVYECKNLTDESIKAVAEGCPELKELNVEECSKLTDESIKAIARGCPELKVLNVGHIQNLTDSSVKAIAKGCRELKVLNVGHVQNLTDSSITAIAKRCRELKVLNVGHIQNLTDESIKTIAKGCPELKELIVTSCRLSMEAISEGCPRLEVLDAGECGLESLPSEFFERLTCLTTLDLWANLLSSLPPSIAKHKHLRTLNVLNNPLQSPPYEIAKQGVDAIKRYLLELEKGSSVSKLLKVVLVGDGEAGKTSLRNALAGRPKPRQEQRTIHIDIEKITLTADLDINVYDCGGQEEYLATQLPYLNGLALYLMVVEARYATDEYAHVVEDKLLRFLVILQNRVPGAVVLPIVTKVDTIKDPERRCHWLESKIERWLQDTRITVCGKIPVSSSDRLQPPAFLASVSDADNVRNAGNSDEHLFIPLRVQSPVLAVSVADAEDVQAVSSSVRAVRDGIIALTKHNPPLLRGVGQKVPTTYLAVLKLFGAIAEYGDNDRALEALRDDTAHALGESSNLSPAGTYRPQDELEILWKTYRQEVELKKKWIMYRVMDKLKNMWITYRKDPNGSVENNVFDDATQLWEAQGVVFNDAGLVFLQPEFITTIVKPLVDHRHNDNKERGHFENAITNFLGSMISRNNDSYNHLIEALAIFNKSGEVDCSFESLFLSFLWRATGLDKRHYGQILQMLSTSGVILKSERDAGQRRTIVVVPFRLPKSPDLSQLQKFWPESLPLKKRELKLRFEPISGFPTGLAERFVTDAHGLGTSLYSWKHGVVVKNTTGYTALAERRENVLHFTVRFESHSIEYANVAWKALCNAQQMLEAQRKNRFPGLFYKEHFACEECCRSRRKQIEMERFDPQRRTWIFGECGHQFDLVWERKFDVPAVVNHFNGPLSHMQLNACVHGDAKCHSESSDSCRQPP